MSTSNFRYDISSALNALSLAVNGLRNSDHIDENALSGFKFIIDGANNKAHVLMKPIWLEGE